MTPPPDLSEFEKHDRIQELENQLAKANKRVTELRNRNEALVDATREGAKNALLQIGPMGEVPEPPKDKRKDQGEVALWHLTDWQGAKETTTYNTEVMKQRVLQFCDKAHRLTDIQRAAHPVRDCFILFGGDALEGIFNFPSQPFEIDATLFGQLSTVGRLEAEVARRALAIYENVTVIDEYGNHGRLGSKRAAVPPSDNLDRMAYEQARAWLSQPDLDLPVTDWKLPERLTWEDDEEDIKHFEIGNYAALLIHGDEVGRMGYASPDTVAKHIVGWKSGAYPHAFRDVYMGHIHRHDERALPDGEGALYITGSPETDNRYARDKMASAGKPTQRLHFIDPDAGRVTAQYKVFLD